MIKPLGIDPTQCFIAGAWAAANAGQTLDLTNPSDGTTLCAIARGGAEDIDDAVTAAQSAMDGVWGKTTAAERGRVLAKIGQLVLDNTEELARLEALDVGKPLTQARADVLALARCTGIPSLILMVILFIHCANHTG